MITIQPLQPHQISAAKNVIATVCQEIWSIDPEELFSRWDSMPDIDDFACHYLGNSGTFLVLMDGNTVIGTGAVRALDATTGELKRMWLLKDYRGRGLGKTLVLRLVDFARQAGYERLRLDVFDPERQATAIALYQRLGFHFIDRYNDGFCSVFMEKVL